MKRIKLKKSNLIAIVDDDDFEYINSFTWIAAGRPPYAYAIRFENGHYIRMHRIILGVTDPKIFVDHANGNTLDNRKCNIRTATHGQNMTNKKGWGLSKYRGVYLRNTDNKWVAEVWKDKKKTFLGSFNNQRDAALAYNIAASRVHGEFAKLNKI